MPNIPNVPGVPPLTSFGVSSDFVLLAGDVATLVNAFLTPPWGIYFEGSPIITPANIFTQAISDVVSAVATIAALVGFPDIVPVSASMVEFDYTKDAPISNYPQQSGGFQSYDKVQLPFEIKVKLACGGVPAQRAAFENTLDALVQSIQLVDVVTPERTFIGCNAKHVDYRRTASNGVQLIVADVWFEEVRETSTATFSSTQNPSDAGQQSVGNVQTQTPSTSLQQQFTGIGSSPY